MICQVLEGVAHMHSKQVVHRDLKPDNIMYAVGPDKKRQAVITTLTMPSTRARATKWVPVGRGATRRPR